MMGGRESATCLVDGWHQEQHDLKKDKVANSDETPSLEEGWKESSNFFSGLMAKEKQQ